MKITKKKKKVDMRSKTSNKKTVLYNGS